MLENNKRLAKNTLFLYLRLFVTMSVSLITSRVVLRTLGETDFGIYNIVGGIVVLFSFFNAAMSTAIQRFLNYELGKKNLENVRRIFSMSISSYLVLLLIIILLGETIGLWFLNNKLNIPIDRLPAANWVYQFTIAAFCVDMLRVPYNASIIAYEKMSFYAYVSMVEIVLKLLIVYILFIFSFDKLKLYAILMFFVISLVTLLYKKYCNHKFIITRYSFFWDKILFKKIVSFSGWSMFGGFASLGAQQGVNILLNIFSGVGVNAAVGIANQITQAMYQFVSNFQLAFNPQIVKSYAVGDNELFHKLVFRASKFSYYLLLLVGIPVMINMDFILQLWLGIVPQYTSEFARVILIYMMIDALSAPLWLSVQATGEIRKYQLVISIILLLNIPLAYMMLKMGYSPVSVWIIRIFINILSFLYRGFYLKRNICFPIGLYCRNVLFIVFIVTILSYPIPFYIGEVTSSWNKLMLTSFFSFLISCSIFYFIGFDRKEKLFVVNILKEKFKKWK